MDKNIKLIIDVSGILISLAGMLLLFYNQYYVAGFAVIFVILILIGIGIKIAISQPITYHSLHFFITYWTKIAMKFQPERLSTSP